MLKGNSGGLIKMCFVKKAVLCTIVFLTCIAVCPVFCSTACAAVNAGTDTEIWLSNPSFEDVTGNLPDGWSVWQWDTTQGVTEFKVEEGDAVSGDRFVTITNHKENDARFRQTVGVEENSRYRVTCWIRTENVGADKTGANISVEGLVFTSRDIKGSNGRWEQIELYIQTGEGVNSFVLTLGVGGYGNTNTGTASFDNVSVEKVETIPAGAAIAVIEPERETAGGEGQEKDSRPFWLMAVAAVAALAAYLHYRKSKSKSTGKTPGNGKPGSAPGVPGSAGKPRLSRIDTVIMSVMTAVYLAVALVNLGSLSVPETGWTPSFSGEEVTIEFSGQKELSRITYFCARGTGWEASGSYILEYRDESGQYQPLTTLEKDNVFVWKYKDVNVVTDSIRIIVNIPGGALNEICFFERGSERPVTDFAIANINAAAPTSPDSLPPDSLFDEQDRYAYNPSYKNGTYFDEIYHARTAYEHINGIEPFENTHPPLGKLFISLGVLLFGMNPFGWRIVGTLFGAAMIPLMYLFGWKVFRRRLLAFCPAFLMMFDFMHFVQSRIATIDIYVTFFVILMFYFMYDYFTVKSYERGFKQSLKPLFLSGLAFGLGAASKWIALYGALGLAFLFFAAKYREYRDYKRLVKKPGKAKRPPWVKDFIPKYVIATCACCVLFFVVIPALIYILSYIPFMCVDGPGHGLGNVISLQKHMYRYHSGLNEGHAFSSQWWQWPIMAKPIWFYTGSGLPHGMKSTIASFGNPAVWWPGIGAFLAAIIISFRKKDGRMAVIITAVLAQYLPWILVPRIAFIYHYFTIIPFMVLCIVYVMEHLMEKMPSASTKYAIYGYLAMVLVLFAVFYPALSGMVVSSSYIDKLRWFKSWIF